MRLKLFSFALAALAGGVVLMPVNAAFAADTAVQAAHYTVDGTPVGKLLDDPAAAAILKKLIPATYGNDMFQSMGRDLTLKGVQQYEPVDLSDEKLAQIQAEFDKIPAK